MQLTRVSFGAGCLLFQRSSRHFRVSGIHVFLRGRCGISGLAAQFLLGGRTSGFLYRKTRLTRWPHSSPPRFCTRVLCAQLRTSRFSRRSGALLSPTAHNSLADGSRVGARWGRSIPLHASILRPQISSHPPLCCVLGRLTASVHGSSCRSVVSACTRIPHPFVLRRQLIWSHAHSTAAFAWVKNTYQGSDNCGTHRAETTKVRLPRRFRGRAFSAPPSAHACPKPCPLRCWPFDKAARLGVAQSPPPFALPPRIFKPVIASAPVSAAPWQRPQHVRVHQRTGGAY